MPKQTRETNIEGGGGGGFGGSNKCIYERLSLC